MNIYYLWSTPLNTDPWGAYWGYVSTTKSQIQLSTNHVTRITTSQLSFNVAACPRSAVFAEERPRLLQIKGYAANQHLIGGNDIEDKSKLGWTPSNLTLSRLAGSRDMVAHETLHSSKLPLHWPKTVTCGIQQSTRSSRQGELHSRVLIQVQP